MGRPYALLRSGFPFLMTLGMRRVTSNAVDVAFGSENRVYVLCRGSLGTEVRVINMDDDNLGTIGGAGTDEGKFTWPACLIVDKEEKLYVSDEALHRISTFDRDGEFLGCWGEHGDGDGQLDRPSGIAFDADENMYVSDTLNHRVQKFTKDGKFLMGWGRLGDGDGEFHRPSSVAVDSDGFIYVADWGNERVQMLDPDGAFVAKTRGEATTSPWAQAFLDANSQEAEARSAADLDPDLTFLDGDVREESHHTQTYFWSPTSVKLDSEERLHVTDRNRHRIQVFKRS